MNEPTDQGLTTFTFGDSKAISDRLVAMVRSGKKTATCSAVESIKQAGEPIPTAGGNEIILNWDGTKALMVHIQSVELVRFCDVPETLALLEGENRTLEGWRRDHREYFERHSVFSWEMVLAFERFEMIHDYQADTDLANLQRRPTKRSET